MEVHQRPIYCKLIEMRSVEHSPAGSDPAKTLKVWQRVREVYRVVRGRDLPKRIKENRQPIPGQA